MTTQPIEKSPDEDASHLLQLRREAEKRSGGYRTLLGLLVGPVLMGSVWLLMGEARAAKASGIWIFYIGSIALVPTAMRFMHFSEKLKNVSQDHSVTVRGVMAPVSKSYRTTYDYSIFRPSDFEAHKKKCTSGDFSCDGCLLNCRLAIH